METEVWCLLRHLVEVAEVDGDSRCIWGDQQISRRAGEAGEVAAVLRMRDQKSIEALFCQPIS